MSLDITLDDMRMLAPNKLRDKTGYLSGPMRGHEDLNFPAFDEARDFLEKRGWLIYSPADLDRFRNIPMEEQAFEECMRRDYTVIARSGALFLLKGWEASIGSNAELFAARTLNISIYEFTYDEAGQINGFEPSRVLADFSETRVVDPNTGGEKGSKLPRFDLIPPDAMVEVAKVYGIGSKKYADNNWLRGYAYGLSYAALQRHANMFWSGEDLDSEGFHHLAAVAWHALALLTFRLRGLGTDDRVPTDGRDDDSSRGS